MWVDKTWTIKDLHLKVFTFIRHVISEWLDWKDPNTTKEPRPNARFDLREDLPSVPYKPADWPEDKYFGKKDFDALDEETAFNMCFPALSSGSEP